MCQAGDLSSGGVTSRNRHDAVAGNLRMLHKMLRVGVGVLTQTSPQAPDRCQSDQQPSNGRVHDQAHRLRPVDGL